MRPDYKKLSAFFVIALAIILSGANFEKDCSAEPPATCFPDTCKHCYCLGPENYGVNAPVRPKTCNGDFGITVSGLFWRANQDGMEYAIKNWTEASVSPTENANLNNLVQAKFLTPHFKWDFGFKAGLFYNTTCDGWDVGLLWTRYHVGTSDHVDVQKETTLSLLPLWSAFQFRNAGNAPILFATKIDTFWKLNLDLIDLDLGREFWTSKYLTFRPHVGLRYAHIDQSFEILHSGGSWHDNVNPDFNVNDTVKLGNSFKGIGLRSGLDTVWNLGCGFGLYGNLAISFVYGRFDVDHDEWIRKAVTPFSKTKL